MEGKDMSGQMVMALAICTGVKAKDLVKTMSDNEKCAEYALQCLKETVAQEAKRVQVLEKDFKKTKKGDKSGRK